MTETMIHYMYEKICSFYPTLWICLCFLVLGTPFAAYPEAIDLEALVAAVKHNDSLLKSGKVSFVLKPTHTQFEAELLGISAPETTPREVSFAFDGRKVYCETRSAIDKNKLRPEDKVAIFDGEKQVEIHRFSPPPRIGVRGRLTIDPRSYFHYWGMSFVGQLIGEYLEENATDILGEERINKIPCYVVEAKRRGGTIKFWIAPSRGFRVLKRQLETTFRGAASTVTMKIHYEKLKNGIWFPKAGTNIVVALNKKTGKRELLFKYSMLAEKSELNVGVSDLVD